MTDYARLLHYVVPYWRRGVAAIIAMIMGALTTLAVPWIIRNIIDDVLAAKNLVALNWIALGILVLFFLRGVFSYLQGYLMSYIANRVIIDIRNEVYARVQRLSLRFFDTSKTGSLMSRLTNDIGALQTAIVDNFVNIVKESVILIGSLVGMVILHWRLTLLCVIIVPLVSITIKYFGRKLKKSGHMMQERIADVTSHLQETIGGIRVVKSFFREDYEIARFRQINQASFGAAMKAAQQSNQLSPVVEFIAAIAVTAIIWYGGWSVIDGELTAGELIAFLIYAINLANPVRRLSALYGDIQRSMAAGERVFALLDETPDIREKADAIALPVLRGDVVFDAVHFQYEPSKEVLSGISFHAEPGQKIALVGPSGSGKSTIANLIPRFYDVTAGAIKIDGQLPQGLQTPIGDRGLVLSGGQRQRIAIARALLKDPRILILDEATSALDTESEQLVQAALERLMIGRTAFIIAHRLTTIQDADHILVIDRGRIVESGTHQSLLALHGMYYNLYTLRLQGDEK